MTVSKKKKDLAVEWAQKQKQCTESGLLDELRVGDDKYFELREVTYPFGKRKVYFQKDQEKYELLQGARCCVLPQRDDNFEGLMESSEDWLQSVNDHDLVRIDELKYIKKAAGDIIPEFSSIAEIGFRTPRLLKHYLDEGFDYAIGYDVLEVNIIAAQSLGYNAQVYDLNSCEEEMNLKDIDLVISYHVLEHVSNPLKAIKKIYDGMSPGGHFHVEVPIEPGVPNIRYCHLFPFHQGDIQWMLEHVGFSILTTSGETHKGGPWVERHLVVKEN